MYPNLEKQEMNIKSELLRSFDLNNINHLELISQRVNAHFLVEEEGSKLVLRVYRDNSFWLPTDLSYRFEVDLMNYLKDNDFSSCYPLKQKNGNFFININLNDVSLKGILLSYAEGKLSCFSSMESKLFGEDVGLFHQLTKGFNTKTERFKYDRDFLLDKTYERLKPWTKTKAHLEALEKVYEYLTNFFNDIDTENLDWGVIHGDLNSRNHHIDTAGKITLYDFDMSGYGFREYDLGVFYKECIAQGIDVFDDFMDGYRIGNRESKINIDAIKSFALARQFWQIGVLSTFPENDNYFEGYFSSGLDFSVKLLEHIK